MKKLVLSLLFLLLLVNTSCSKLSNNNNETVNQSGTENHKGLDIENDLEDQGDNDGEDTGVTDLEKSEEKIYLNNHNGNILNGGNYLIVDNWLYYANTFDNDYLYKMRLNGEDVQRMTDHPVIDLHFADGWIYYIHYEKVDYWEIHSQSLNKVKIDGSEQQIVLNEPIWNLHASGEYLLFFWDSTIHKLKTGEDEVTPLPYIGLTYTASGENIIFYNHDGYHLGNIDGTVDEVLFFPSNGEYILDGSDLYYTEAGQTGLFRYSLEDRETVHVITEPIDYFNVKDGTIYFSNANLGEAGRKLYQVDREGNRRRELKTIINSIHIFDDYVVGHYGRQGYFTYTFIDKETGNIRNIEITPEF